MYRENDLSRLRIRGQGSVRFAAGIINVASGNSLLQYVSSGKFFALGACIIIQRYYPHSWRRWRREPEHNDAICIRFSPHYLGAKILSVLAGQR